MSFIKKIIENRLVQFPHRYKLTKVDGTQDTYDLEPITGNVTSVGTPVDKALLQRYEDTLTEHETAIGNKLDKTGDSKGNTVTFIEAVTDADIVTGENHATLFSKIKKRFSTIATTLTNINTALNGKAPNNHGSTATTYGLGTTANYGHVKTINALTQTSHADGTALSAYQGKVLNDKINNIETRDTVGRVIFDSIVDQSLGPFTARNPGQYNYWLDIGSITLLTRGENYILPYVDVNSMRNFSELRLVDENNNVYYSGTQVSPVNGDSYATSNLTQLRSIKGLTSINLRLQGYVQLSYDVTFTVTIKVYRPKRGDWV